MEKLHQLDVFGSRLVVEYAKTSHSSVVHEAKLDKYVFNKYETYPTLYCNIESPIDYSYQGGPAILVKMSLILRGHR